MKKAPKELMEYQKPVELIQFDARKVTLLQRKIMNVLLWKFYNTVERDSETYNISAKELSDLLKIKTRYGKSTELDIDTSRTILKDLRVLKRLEIEWDILKKDEKRHIGVSNIVSYVDISEAGNIEYGIPKPIREILLKNNPFEWINIEITSLFRSKYAISLYENSKRFIGIKKTGYWDAEKFKKLIGVPSDTIRYSKFSVVKKDIIEPAVQEINELSDIKITPEYKYASKTRITELQFRVELKPNPGVRLPEGLTPKDILETTASLSPDKYKEAIKKFYAENIVGDPQLEELYRNKGIDAFLEQGFFDFFVDHYNFDVEIVLTHAEKKQLMREANQCYKKRQGNCAAKWSEYSNRKKRSCHYCQKFKETRNALPAE